MKSSSEGKDKLLTWFTILFFLAGFGLAYLGWEKDLAVLIYAGLILIGAAVIWWGGDAIRTKSSSYQGGGQDGSFSYSFGGIAAVMDGIVLVLLGTAMLGFGLISLLGFQMEVLAFIKLHPGGAMIIGGLSLAAYSLTLILGAREENLPALKNLANLPKRFLGILLLVGGLGVMLLGGLAMISPDSYQALIAALIATLDPVN